MNWITFTLACLGFCLLKLCVACVVNDAMVVAHMVSTAMVLDFSHYITLCSHSCSLVDS